MGTMKAIHGDRHDATAQLKMCHNASYWPLQGCFLLVMNAAAAAALSAALAECYAEALSLLLLAVTSA